MDKQRRNLAVVVMAIGTVSALNVQIEHAAKPTQPLEAGYEPSVDHAPIHADAIEAEPNVRPQVDELKGAGPAKVNRGTINVTLEGV